jgi:hypothetical protein
MKLELIELSGGISLTASRVKFKVIHLTSSGRTEHSYKPEEALKYVEDYCTREKFRITNVSARKLGYTIALVKD